MLSERKKSDRAKMAAIIEALAREFGASVSVEKEGENSIMPRRIQVSIVAKKGLACHFDFDGESCQPNVFVNPWHIGTDSDACLSSAFPGSVNNCHFRKSTTVSHGFEDLCAHVRQVLEMARDGRAFDPEREAAHIAKNGTAAERAAKWAEYRAEMQAAKACA